MMESCERRGLCKSFEQVNVLALVDSDVFTLRSFMMHVSLLLVHFPSEVQLGTLCDVRWLLKVVCIT